MGVHWATAEVLVALSAEKCDDRHELSAEKCENTMQRIVLQDFIEWKKLSDRKPLIVNGSCQA